MNVKLVWITPDAENLIAYMARVSNPNAKEGDPSAKLIKYLINHKHWSPFEMACMCVEIETTRDIARQILRHRSFHFQEFSQRYAQVNEEPVYSMTRVQDTKNRQNSNVTDDSKLKGQWRDMQFNTWEQSSAMYQHALSSGIAKELARKLLPEGLTQTKMYMQGTLRDWLHYIGIRTGVETQYEHRVIATRCGELLNEACPTIVQAAFEAGIVSSPLSAGQVDHSSGGTRL